MRVPHEKVWLQFERLLLSLEGADVVKWRQKRRVRRKEVVVVRGCIGGGIRRGCAAAAEMVEGQESGDGNGRVVM